MKINKNDKENAISNYLSYLQLKYDCETLYSLTKVIKRNGVIGLGMMPYYTLTVSSICELLPESIKKQLPYYKQIENIRLKLKFFEDGYGRSERMILNIDYLQNEDFKNQLAFSWLKDKNIHYNIGIYTNKDKIIVGNTQYAYYLLQDNRFLKKSLADVAAAYSVAANDFDLNEQTNKECYQYAYTCGKILSIACSLLKDFDVPIKVDTKKNNVDFYYADYNTNNSNFFLIENVTKGRYCIYYTPYQQ